MDQMLAKMKLLVKNVEVKQRRVRVAIKPRVKELMKSTLYDKIRARKSNEDLSVARS